MNVKEILARLKAMGDDARRKHNIKSGAPENQFGAKLGDIRTLAKKLKPPNGGHKLGLELWATGNVEAQLLATLLVEPKSLSAAELEKLVRSTTYAQVAEWLNSYVVAHHPDREALRQKWMSAAPARDPWSARAGWGLTASRVNRDA